LDVSADSPAEAPPDGETPGLEPEVAVSPRPCSTPSVAAFWARPDGLSPASDTPAFGLSPSRRSFTVCPVVRGRRKARIARHDLLLGKDYQSGRKNAKAFLAIAPQPD
jgi:hypothetical protein